MNKYKSGVKSAIENYYKRELSAQNTAPRKNNKPEEPVVIDCLKWLKQNGFHVQRVESKAVKNHLTGNWSNPQIQPGTPDIIGNSPEGIGVFVEVKAPGKRSSVRVSQYKYLSEKLKINCFVAVVDSAKYLETMYKHWCHLRLGCLDSAKQYLERALPIPPELREDTSSLFDE
jgi:hypothetical protein